MPTHVVPNSELTLPDLVIHEFDLWSDPHDPMFGLCSTYSYHDAAETVE